MFTSRQRHAGSWSGLVFGALYGLLAVFGDLASWLIVAGGILALAGLIWAAYDLVRSHRMHDEYREFAQRHGWTYANRSYEFNHRFSGFPFGQGSSRRQESVLQGTFNGQRCATFAHVFEIRRRGDRSAMATQAYQVTLAELPVALPRIDIVPENVPAAIAKALGGGDVDVESHEFNRRFRVITQDQRYAHAVLDPRMIERLLYPDMDGLGVRIDGGAVYVWSMGRQGADSLAHRLGVVSGIARRIPDHVLRQYKELGYHVREGDAWTRPLSGPAWATESGALTSGRYTGVGVDADGDGIEDWKQLGHLGDGN